jgi:hypothetical protein
MSMQTIRSTYGVQAKRNGEIRFTDRQGGIWQGHIKSARHGRLRVALDDLPGETAILHPTWLEYLCNTSATTLNP